MSKVTNIVRMDRTVYSTLEKKVAPNVVVSNTVTDIEAGFKLGVQFVLRELRDGFVVESNGD